MPSSNFQKRYPWAKWEDGNEYIARKGDAFTDPDRFRAVLYQRAARLTERLPKDANHRIKVATSQQEDGSILFQFYEEVL